MKELLSDLDCVLKAGPVAVLVRHAERFPITDPTCGHNAALTESGKLNARLLGDEIGARIQTSDSVILGHSPVPRCQETAEMIGRGIGSRHPNTYIPKAFDHLGGPYFRDAKSALELYRDEGAAFLRRWFNDAVPGALIAPFREAAEQQIVQSMSVSEGSRLAILISHDLNIMLVREYVFGIRHEDSGWPDYLDGVVMTADGPSLLIGYRGIWKRISVPD